MTMENQSIEKRYLDRQKLINLLERLFSGNYFIEEQQLKTVLTIPRKLTETEQESIKPSR